MMAVECVSLAVLELRPGDALIFINVIIRTLLQAARFARGIL